MKANQVVVDLLNEITGKKNATPAQIAMAWLLAQKPWIVPIPGLVQLDHLEENLGAANVKLTLEDLHEIEDAFSKLTIKGERLCDVFLKDIER
ncbi:MAG: aldo/keto reductase [Firmicutes bacterium]|nr:aldo/keto reductase [Bacillota bacterium]